MSQENVEAFKRVIEALNRRDIESLLERYDPDVEARYALESLLGGEAVVHRGHEGVREAFQAGVINHALFMSGMAGTAESGPQRTSRAPLGEVNAPNAPALGQHFWLDVTPSQIDALSVPEWQKIILRAIAKYGMYVGDNGGAPWALQFESGDNYTSFGKPDPWVDTRSRRARTTRRSVAPSTTSTSRTPSTGPAN
jgi:hypothetical protein